MTTSPVMRPAIAALVAVLALAVLPSFSGLAQGAELSITIQPAIEGNTAVRTEQDVLVSGSAPTGNISAARLVGTQANGNRVSQTIPSSALNKAPGDGLYLRNNNGSLEGRLRLGCLFGPPAPNCGHSADAHQVSLEVTVGGQTAESNTLRVDFVRPFIRGYELVRPDRIRVVFSEPVRNESGDSRDDWVVSQPQRTILRVEGPTEDDCVGRYEPGEDSTAGATGCTRTLVLLTDLDEDATPLVETSVQGMFERGQYTDYASNGALIASRGARSHALDLIRAPLPRIESVAGSEPDQHDRTTGNSVTPEVRVSNLRAGHTVHFYVNDELVLSEEADAATHTAQLPDIGHGGEFEIHAVVEDPGGNLSTEGQKYTVRSDASPSRVCYGFGELCDLPLLPGPNVLEPADELYTQDAAVEISGVVEPAMEGIDVELRNRTTGQDVAGATTGEDGSWAFAVSLDLERRYQYEVLTRDGERTLAEPVPDIILDTTNPLAQVVQPGPDPTQILSRLTLDTRSRFSEGDAVNVAWLATDPALLDLANPDHGSHVDIDIVFADGPRRTVTPPDGLDYTPLTQSHAHVVTAQDMGSQDREARFDVTVTDLAGNAAQSLSLPVVLDADILGYLPVFVRNEPNNSVVEARFSVTLDGETTPLDWRIDGQVPQAVNRRDVGGVTIVDLVASQSITDPNATPTVRFQPPAVGANRLRGQDGRAISDSPRVAVDGIPPALSFNPPDPGPRSADSVTVTGQTDQTSRPNQVRAVRDGRVVGQTTAAENGQFSLTVPLAPDRLNRVELRAVDPASNRSSLQVFEVIEDSTPPVVVIDNPIADTPIPRSLPIRWSTIDNNPDVVDIEYRVGAGTWEPLVSGLPDNGAHRWQIPASIPEDARLSLRVTATDQAGHRGHGTTAAGLRLKPFLLAACDDVDPAPFTDRQRVPEVHRWAVDCLYELGIAKGSPRGGQLWFDPQTDISRAQFSGFLSRTLHYAGVELPEPGRRFDDVPAGHTFDADIHRLTAAEVILGYDERHFGPRDPIKRDQTASLLLRALEHAREEEFRAVSGAYFGDTASSAHRRSIDAAYEHGLVLGRTAPSPGAPGVYDPGALTTRAQMATVLVRAIGQFDG